MGIGGWSHLIQIGKIMKAYCEVREDEIRDRSDELLMQAADIASSLTYGED